MKGIIKFCILLTIAIGFATCAQHSPGAKVSTIINVSLTSPTTVPL